MSFRPPETYEELIRLIHDRYDDMSKSYQKDCAFDIRTRTTWLSFR